MPDPRLAVEPQPYGHQRIIGGITRGLIAAIIVLYLAEFDVKLPPLTVRFVMQAATAFLFSVAVHELGHLAGGKLNGMKLLVFAAWPIRLERRGTTWRIAWLRRSRVSGFVAMDPSSERNLRRRMFFLAAAGPLASLLVSVTAFGLTRMAVFHWPGWAMGTLQAISFWSALMAVLGFLPIPSRFSVNDGTRLLVLLRGGSRAERFGCLALLAPNMLTRIRPREWRRDLVDRLPGPLDGSLDAMSAQAIRYNFLLDSGQIDEADKILEWLVVQSLPGEARVIWRLEAVWMQAMFRADLPGARQWLDACGARLKTPDGQCALWKARAAVAFLEQRWADAEEAIREALQACQEMSDNGITQVIREELSDLSQDLEMKKRRQNSITA